MIIALSGPSGAGKGYLKERLINRYPFIQELIWITTRPIRVNESCNNRVSVSISEFEKLAKENKIILIQDLYGHRYGIRRDDFLDDSGVKLTELHPSNIKDALKINPSIIVIGLIASDLLLLQKRLSMIRKTESDLEIKKRISMANLEIDIILQNKEVVESIFDVSQISEELIFDQVVGVLAPYLVLGGDFHVSTYKSW